MKWCHDDDGRIVLEVDEASCIHIVAMDLDRFVDFPTTRVLSQEI